MSEVWILEEHREGMIADMKVFKSKEKAEEFRNRRIDEIRCNRESDFTTREYDFGVMSIIWLDEYGDIEYDEYGNEIELCQFHLYVKQVL